MPKRKPDDRKLRRYERAMSSYDRRPGNRSPGQCILIVCEGEKTEPNYFASLRDHLKLSTVSVKITERAGAPISLVNEALSQRMKRQQDIRSGRINLPNFEEIWCVFDVENPRDNQTFGRAVHVADKNEFQLAVSNPAFEFWYILHFEHTTRPFADGDEIKEYLRRYIPGYHAAMPVFDKLPPTRTALQHAKKILENHPQGEQRFPNPSTLVHLLAEKMIEMSPSGRQHVK
ncbi:MAG: RloB domain-containing protein [Anaerolineae bacterium]|uniref:RloB family protein n=1 Tax=Candidatus Amarolinea dominans TaxID=3140696 RepID=UPI0031369971|nr:RloB domain-containing protein [Anaerolineae bacterium]